MSETRPFSIIEILQYVRKNGETGCLKFTENGNPIAELFFNKGHLIHARNGRVIGDDVVYQLLGNKTAKAKWDRQLTTAEESISRNDEMLMLGALGILTEDDTKVVDLVLEEDNSPVPVTTTAPVSSVATAPPRPVVSPPPDKMQATRPDTDWDGAAILDLAAAATPQLAPTPPVQAVASPPPVIVPEPAQVINDISPAPLDEPVLHAGASLESMGRLRKLLGDEVLRPPRFRRWTGLPLPFVSAYSLDPYLDGRSVRNVVDLLWRENFSGFMTVIYGQTEGFMLLYKGRNVHCRYADPKSNLRDQSALRNLVSIVVSESEKHSILIYPLEPDFVQSYAALLMGDVLLDKFSSQGMKINKLLNTLEHSQHTGVVRVSTGDENGFIFLSNGHKLGSFYEVDDVLEESILRVYQIVAKAGSLIDVLTSPSEDKMVETTNRPKSAADVKQQIIEIAQEVFGKRASRVVSLVGQSEDDVASLKTYCNQARRVAQMFIDKSLADQFYERSMFLLQELN